MKTLEKMYIYIGIVIIHSQGGQEDFQWGEQNTQCLHLTFCIVLKLRIKYISFLSHSQHRISDVLKNLYIQMTIRNNPLEKVALHNSDMKTPSKLIRGCTVNGRG